MGAGGKQVPEPRHRAERNLWPQIPPRSPLGARSPSPGDTDVPVPSWGLRQDTGGVGAAPCPLFTFVCCQPSLRIWAAASPAILSPILRLRRRG